MKLTEYIAMLTELLNKHGDLTVKNSIYPQCTVTARLEYMRIPINKRQILYRFYHEGSDLPDQKGEKVIAVYAV